MDYALSSLLFNVILEMLSSAIRKKKRYKIRKKVDNIANNMTMY